MSSAASRAWKVVKPHIPLIKFRKGRVASHNEQATTVSSKKILIVDVDESQLPAKYARKPLSQLEIEYIERGGPE